MAIRAVAACLVALVLVPICSGTGTGVKAKAKAKAKTKDPWDAPDGGSEELEAAPAGAMESEMSPDDQANMIQQVVARSATRRAHSQHAVMSQFMSNFANNMRLSVLADSKGDMPEEERQRLIAKAESQKAANSGDPFADGGGGGAGVGAPPPEEAEPEEDMPPPPPRHHRMLNMAATRHRQHRRPKLLPEAEGIGFPPPEGMAPDPATDGIVNDPGMADGQSLSGPPEEEEEAPPPQPRPRPRRHRLHMLNAPPGEGRRAHPPHRRHAAPPARSEHKLPAGVVRDEMGRAMPLLFTGSKPAHSGAFRVESMAVVIACLFLTQW